MSRSHRTVGISWRCLLLACAVQATTAGAQTSTSVHQSQLPWLFKSVTQDTPPIPEDVRFDNTVFIQVDTGLLRDKTAVRFRARLPGEDTPVTIVRDRVERRGNGLDWFGSLEGEPGSHVILSVVGDSVAGGIQSFDRPHFSIQPVGDIQFLRLIDFRASIPEAGGIPTSPSITLESKGCGDPESEIDVMVLYTDEARLVGTIAEPYTYSTSEMEAEIYRFVAESNESFVDSDVVARLRVIHIEQVEGVLSGPLDATASPIEVRVSENIDTDLLDLQSNTAVQDLRDLHGADLVVLLVKQESDPGRSTQPIPAASALHSDAAFSVVVMAYAEDQHTFTHEIGHPFGADHNCDSVDPPVDPTTKAHGFDPGTGLDTTLMSTTDPGHRLLRWSDPNADYPGDSGVALGSTSASCPADNHEVINYAAPYVANYRCSSPGRNDVWMKDNWFDTGDEPSTTTLFDPIWNSPYIWIRRESDPDRLHQHEHQDPVAGQQEFVYVKLQNGTGTSQEGDLKVYWADSSLDIAWESGWELIGSTHVTGFAANSVLIVETEWNPVPPASDSVCLLARWVSATDPMTVAEGPNVWPNTANNNNIIWRNIEIVSLWSVLPGWVRTSLICRTRPGRLPPDLADEDEELQHVVLHIPPPPESQPRSFVRDGRVLVRLDDVLMQAWTRTGRHGEGYRLEDGGFLLSPEPDGSTIAFDLPPGVEGQIELEFRRRDSTPRRNYLLDIVQTVDGRPVGGMSYSILCAPPPPEQVSEPAPPASSGPGG